MVVEDAYSGKPPDIQRLSRIRLIRLVGILGLVLALAHVTTSATIGSAVAASELSRSDVTEEPMVFLRDVRFSGVTVFDEGQFASLYADMMDREVSFRDLEAIAGRVTRYYRDHGYPVARAFLPAQTIEDGSVHIAVAEGRYGAVRIENNSALRDELGARWLHQLQPGDVVYQPVLNETLLLLNDVPGIQVTSSLQPGTEPGHSDLVVRIDDAKRWHTRLFIDNLGHSSTGRGRLQLTSSYSNVSGRGDRVYVSGLLTERGGQRDGRIGYATLLGRRPTELDVSVRVVDYSLGGPYQLADYQGDKLTGQVAFRYPLHRAPGETVKLATDLGFHHIEQKFGSSVEKHIHFAALGLNGQKTAGARSWGYSLRWVLGHLDISPETARDRDAANARTQGTFSKLEGSARYSRWTNRRTRWDVFAQGQFTRHNLDASEKFTLGGEDGVRAYPPSVGRGDIGVLARISLSHSPKGLEELPGTLFVQGFVDAGTVKTHVHPRGASAERGGTTLAGAGVGLHWSHKQVSTRLEYACKIRTGQEGLADEGGSCRVWAQLGISL